MNDRPTHTAIVVDVVGDRVRLAFPPRQECRGCGVCGSAPGVAHDEKRLLEVENTIRAGPGDTVLVDVGFSRLAISGLLCGVPTVLLLSGLLVGIFGFDSPPAGLVSGILLMGIYLFLLKKSSLTRRVRLKKI